MTHQDYFGNKEDQLSWAYFAGYVWYMECLEYHSSILDVAARLGLIEGWYICIHEIGYEDLEEFGIIRQPLIWACDDNTCFNLKIHG